MSDTDIRVPHKALVPTVSGDYQKFWKLPKKPKLPPHREWVFFVQAVDRPNLIKIGKTSELRWRLITLQTNSPVELKLIAVCTAPAGTAPVLHEMFATALVHADWFRPIPRLCSLAKLLPIGGPIPVDLAESWASNVGMKLGIALLEPDPKPTADAFTRDVLLR